MRQIIKQFARLALFSAMAFTAFACRANSPNLSQNLLAVAIHDSGHLILTLEGRANTEGCATPGLENMVLIRKDHPNFKLFYTMALTALLTGRQVNGWVNGCTDVWENGNIRIVNGTTLEIRK